jgi:CBS-domain-containing membrane protein
MARPDEPLVDLLPRMAGCTDGRAVVLDDAERVVAVISPRDIAQVAALADLRRAGPLAPQSELAPRVDPPAGPRG